MLYEPVGERARGEGLARAGGHLDQRARVGLGEGLLNVRDAFELAVAHTRGGEGMRERHLREPRAQRVRLLQPLGERLRPVKGKH